MHITPLRKPGFILLALFVLLIPAQKLLARGWHVSPDGKDYIEYTAGVAGDYYHPLKLEFVLANKLPGGGILVSPGDTVWVHGNLYNFDEKTKSQHYQDKDYTPYTGYYKAPVTFKDKKGELIIVPSSQMSYDFYLKNCLPGNEVTPIYDSSQDYTFKEETLEPDSCYNSYKKVCRYHLTHIKGYTVSNLRYPSFYTSYLKGSPTGGPAVFNYENPIIVRAYGNERATLDSKKMLSPKILNCYVELNTSIGKFTKILNQLLTVDGQYTYFWGIEFTNSNPNHLSCNNGNDKVTDLGLAGGVEIVGIGNRTINCVAHNLTGDGIDAYSSALKSKIDGCIIYNDGWANTANDRAHGHGIYLANNPDSIHSFKEVAHNFLFDIFDMGLHVYKTSKADGPITGLKIHDNVAFNSGKIAGKIIPAYCRSRSMCMFDTVNTMECNGIKYFVRKRTTYQDNIILGGHSGMQYVDLINNHVYDDLSIGKRCDGIDCNSNPESGGYEPNNFVLQSQGRPHLYTDINIENNCFIGGQPVQMEDLRKSKFRNNFIYGNKNLLMYNEHIDSQTVKHLPESKYHYFDLDWDSNEYVYKTSFVDCNLGFIKFPLIFHFDILKRSANADLSKRPEFGTITSSSGLLMGASGKAAGFISNYADSGFWKGFQPTLGLELHPAWFSASFPPGWDAPKEFFIGNMDSGRKGMLVYNIGEKPVEYYYSMLGGFVPVGHEFRIRDVQDYYNKGQQFTATYTGVPVAVELRYSVGASTSSPPGDGKKPKTKEYPGNSSYNGYVKNYAPEIADLCDGVNNTGDAYHTDEGFNTFILEFAPAFSIKSVKLDKDKFQVFISACDGYIPGNFEWSNSRNLKMEEGSAPGSRIITVPIGKCVTISSSGKYIYNGLAGVEKLEICNK